MARKTKQDAEQTRQLLLDTAERVFRERGVASTSLADIASAAGLTRGALYWHFANKLDLFHALCDRIVPQLDAMDAILYDERLSPAARLWQRSLYLFRLLRDDSRLRNVCGIHHLGCEQVGDMAPLLLEQVSWTQEKQGRLQQAFEAAQACGQLRAGIAPRLAAIGLHALCGGLVHSMMIDSDGSTIQDNIETLLTPYFDGVFHQRCWLPGSPAPNA